MTYSFPNLEPVLFYVQSNCYVLTCIQISPEAGQVVWYSHLFQNFPQFILIHTVKGFGIVNKAEINVCAGGSKVSCRKLKWLIIISIYNKPWRQIHILSTDRIFLTAECLFLVKENWFVILYVCGFYVCVWTCKVELKT